MNFNDVNTGVVDVGTEVIDNQNQQLTAANEATQNAGQGVNVGTNQQTGLAANSGFLFGRRRRR